MLVVPLIYTFTYQLHNRLDRLPSDQIVMLRVLYSASSYCESIRTDLRSVFSNLSVICLVLQPYPETVFKIEVTERDSTWLEESQLFVHSSYSFSSSLLKKMRIIASEIVHQTVEVSILKKCLLHFV